jgi:hypothetical protein
VRDFCGVLDGVVTKKFNTAAPQQDTRRPLPGDSYNPLIILDYLTYLPVYHCCRAGADGADSLNRTDDLPLTRRLLYQLSYAGAKAGL